MLGNSLWWQDLVNTVIITVMSVIIELLGFGLALVMHRAIFGRGDRAVVVAVPYGIITVVAAFAWRFAFDPTTGFVNGLCSTPTTGWFSDAGRSLFVIIVTEVWKTTPFMALLLLAASRWCPTTWSRRPGSTAPPPGSASARSSSR